MKFLAAAAAACLAWPCAAQSPQPRADVPPKPVAVAASAAASGAGSGAAPSGVPEPQVQRIVVEDDRVRIDELRIRGQTRRIVVQPKLPGAPAYQIGTNTDARDPAMDPRSEGRTLWQLFSW
ncbi:MAG TPA: hypothetical protein P5163_09465 [Rubrivivax sp.]|nr:hypothetical protein [Rubrivivax sp.]HRY87667.1 hypothetical protein [Rubrivivax sp.]HRZ60811.1 hypothetical protein [Rubrivivax sp.]